MTAPQNTSGAEPHWGQWPAHPAERPDGVQQAAPTLRVGGKYNWRNQPERLSYMGVKRYPGDRRDWHQFEQVEAPGVVWCEVLEADLAHFEATEPASPRITDIPRIQADIDRAHAEEVRLGMHDVGGVA